MLELGLLSRCKMYCFSHPVPSPSAFLQTLQTSCPTIHTVYYSSHPFTVFPFGLPADPPNQLPDETVEHYCCRRWLTSRSAVEIEELWFRGRPQLLMPSMAQVESNKEMARRRGYNTPAQRQRRCRQYKVVTAIEAVAEALATTTHEAAQLLDLMITTGDSDDPREFSSLSNLGQSGWPAIVEKVQKGLFRLNLPAEIRPKRRRGNHFS